MVSVNDPNGYDIYQYKPAFGKIIRNAAIADRNECKMTDVVKQTLFNMIYKTTESKQTEDVIHNMENSESKLSKLMSTKYNIRHTEVVRMRKVCNMIEMISSHISDNTTIDTDKLNQIIAGMVK